MLNRNNPRRVLTAMLVACLLTTLVAPVSAQDKISGLRRLPDNVQFMFRIPSIAVFKERWNQSAIGGLQDDEAFADVRSQLMEKWDELSAVVEAQVDVTLAELIEVPNGEVVLALMPSAGNQIGLVAMVEFGESGEVVETLIEKATDAAEDSGADVTTETIEGVRVTLVADPDNEKKRAAFCVHDSTFVIANSVGAVEGVLVRWDGQSDRTFADNEVYGYIAEQCRVPGHEEPVMEYFIDLIGVMTTAIRSQRQQNFQAQMILTFLPSLGLNSFRGVGGAFDMATSDYDTVNKALIYVDPPATGVLGLFQFPSTPMSPPVWVPDNVTTYMAVNWDIPTAFSSAEKLVDMFQGTGALAKILDRLANDENGPQLHLKTDVLDLLSGRIDFFTDMADPEQVGSDRVCVGLGLRDQGEAMSRVLDKIAQTNGFPGKVRQFQDVTLYEFDVPNGGPGGATFALAATRGYLFFVSDVKLLEQVLRADLPPLSDLPLYKRIAGQFPEEVSAIGFQRKDPQIRALYELLRGGALNESAGGIDLSTLPPFEDLQKYYVPTGSYGVPDERGAVMVEFGLKPE